MTFLFHSLSLYDARQERTHEAIKFRYQILAHRTLIDEERLLLSRRDTYGRSDREERETLT